MLLDSIRQPAVDPMRVYHRSLLSWAGLRNNVLWPRFESQQHSPKIASQGNAIDDALIPVFQEHFTGQTNECQGLPHFSHQGIYSLAKNAVNLSPLLGSTQQSIC